MNASTLVCLALVSFTFDMPETSPALSNQFTVVSWNVDSNQPDPHLPALHMSQMQGVDLWGLAGVRNPWWADLFRGAAAENGRPGVTSVLSPTRGGNRLLILYDPRVFDLITTFELDWEGEPWRTPYVALRPALVGQLRHLATGQEFFFMVNALHPDWAAQQAERLARWIHRQSLPVLAVGTYWFQYNLGPQSLRCPGQAGLSAIQTDGIQWVRPVELVKTYDGPCNTIEDFVFLADGAGRMYGQSRIMVGPADFSGRSFTGSHRPVRATFTVVPSTPEVRLRRHIEQRLRKVETELSELEALIRQLPE